MVKIFGWNCIALWLTGEHFDKGDLNKDNIFQNKGIAGTWLPVL